MLLRPDATYIDEATKRAERVFPRGTDWLHFESKLPGAEVFANSVLDPSVGLSGGLGFNTFANADWQNWISSAQIGMYEIATRIGVPRIEGRGVGQALSSVYTNIETSLKSFGDFQNPEDIVPELLKNAGLQALQQLVGEGSMIAQTVAQVIAAAVWAVDVWASKTESDLAKTTPLPPLQTEDPATDSWQVNRVFELLRQRGSGGVAYPDGKIEGASNADYTSLFLPAYKSTEPWQIQHREKGVAAQQGQPREARGPGGATSYRFDPGDVSTFGFMPGTTTTLRVLQASYRFYASVRGTPVDRYTLRCKGVDRPCYKRPKTFDGSRDCRQCVKAESVWPQEGIGWAYGGAPLNATTPGENVGAFYPSTNKLLLNLLQAIAKPGPLLYTVDADMMDRQWKRSFESFWTFAESEWQRHPAPGWRGMISRLATLMTSFDEDGEPQLGGRDPDMPLSRIASPREGEFKVPFSASIYSRIIFPFCRELGSLQLRELDTIGVAYIPPGAGALYFSSGEVRGNKLGDAFLSARQALLASNKRMLVDLRQVTDPEYRKELERAGVKPSPVNPLLQGSPGVEHELLKPSIKPRRVPPRPKIVRATPFDGTNKLSLAASIPELTVSSVNETAAGGDRDRLALGMAAGGALAVTAGLLGLQRVLSRPR